MDRMPRFTQAQQDSAFAFLLRQPRHLPRRDVLERCAVALMTRHDLAFKSADLLAKQAHADLHFRQACGRIELDECTQDLVIVRYGSGQKLALTVNDLLEAQLRVFDAQR